MKECESLTNVNIPDSVTSIGQSAFGYNKIISVTIPDSVTSIGLGAFTNCESLASVNIPDSVTSIGEGAFFLCGLTSVTIPSSVTFIGSHAFSRCDALERLVIPEAFHSRKESNRIGFRDLYPWGFYLPSSATAASDTKPSIRMAPVIMVQGEDGSVKTIEVAPSPDGPWRFWMTVTATESGVAITDLDRHARKRFYRVVD